MSQIEIAVTLARNLETVLVEKFQASGKGLHEKLSSVEAALPASLVKQLRYVATMRNSVVHEAGFSIPDLDGFVASANAALEQLRAMPGATLTPTETNVRAEWLRTFYRSFVLAGILFGGGLGLYAGGIGLGIATALGGGFLALLAVSDEAIAFYKNVLWGVLGLVLIGAAFATIGTLVSVFR